MSLYLLAGQFLQIVREPQYPELVTLLAEDRALLEGAHPGGPGAVCESFLPLFPWALHVERWALPREFWSLNESSIPRLDHPVTPEPLCWRFEGLRATQQRRPDASHEASPEADTGTDSAHFEEVTGFVSLADLQWAKAQLAEDLDSVGFYPWFDDVTAGLPVRKQQH